MFSYDLFIVIVKFPEAATGGTPKNTFFIEYLQMTAFEFPQKDIDKFKVSDKRRYKKDSCTKKKAKHGTEGNKLKCQLLSLKV